MQNSRDGRQLEAMPKLLQPHAVRPKKISPSILNLYRQMTPENWSKHRRIAVIPSPTAGLSKILFNGEINRIKAFLFNSYLLARTNI